MANRRFIDFPIASTVGDDDIVLIWQDGRNKQTTKATILTGLPENLDQLNDVVISGLTNGQILRYDSVTGKWVNTDQGNLDLNDLNDVSIVSPSNGQVLVYNSSTSKWENSSGGFVPYVGAVTTVDLGAQGLRAGYVRFDTSVVTVPDEQGLMYWDASRSTAALIMNGTLQHIGQDTFFYVKNSSAYTIPKGTCVRFAGTDGASGHLLILPFTANGAFPSSYFMGVTAEDIANGEFGQVMHFGELTGIDTTGYTAGALLYASSTVAGAFQTTAPVAPNNIILVAAAVNSKNNGAIVVRPTLGSNFSTNESVKLTSVTDKDLLQYTVTAGVGVWENKTLSQVIGSAYVPSTRTITINGTTQDLSANRTYNVGTVTSVAALTLGTSGTDLSSSVANGTTTPVITLNVPTASATNRGALSAADWSTFNAKQNALTLTTTGTSGAATLVGSTLNIPIYSPDLSGYVPTSRTITINGVTQDLSANRTFNVGTVTSVGLSSSTSGVTIGGSPVTGVGAFTLTIATASGSQQGLLSAADWTTFNNKQNALTNPVTGTGTTNYLPKFTGSTTIGNSAITDDGATVYLISRDLTITRGSYSGFSFGIDQQSSFAFGSTNGRRVAIIRDATAADNGLQFGYDTVDKTGIIAGAATSAGAGIDFYTFNGSAWGNRARVTASGNLLVGTTSDNGARLQVSGTSTFSGNGLFGGASALTGGISGIATNGASFSGMQFRIGDVSKGFIYGSNSHITIDAVGGVGFQVYVNASYSTPALSIATTGAATFSSSVTAGGNVLVPAGSGLAWVGDASRIMTPEDNVSGALIQTPGIIRLNAGGSERVRITSGGNVGIGTTSPAARLMVQDTANTYVAHFSGLNQANGIAIGTNSSNVAVFQGYTRTFSATNNISMQADGGNLLIGTTTSGSSKLRLVGLPTSAAGLSSGDVYNLGGVLMIA